MDKKQNLYIVATPIGNLGDITFRAIEVLKQVDLVLCEDTRESKKLLNHYEIKKPLLSYHQRSGLSRLDEIANRLETGQKLALITDAGTPGLSDPGNELVAYLLEKFGQSLNVVSIPGPSALTALVQVAGTNLAKFTFLGFPPNKKGRETFFKMVAASEYPVIYYESPYRLIKNLRLLKGLLEDETRKLIVGRELTKFFEEIKRGTLEKIISYYEQNADKIKGEFVIIVRTKD